jgi:hypothetical protein
MEHDPQADYRRVNEALVRRLPELRAEYEREIAEWGEEMGPYVIYGAILNPYLDRLLETEDSASDDDLRRVFAVLEELVADPLTTDVVITEVGDHLQGDRDALGRARLFMGPLIAEHTRDRLPFRRPRRLREKPPWSRSRKPRR